MLVLMETMHCRLLKAQTIPLASGCVLEKSSNLVMLPGGGGGVHRSCLYRNLKIEIREQCMYSLDQERNILSPKYRYSLNQLTSLYVPNSGMLIVRETNTGGRRTVLY